MHKHVILWNIRCSVGSWTCYTSYQQYTYILLVKVKWLTCKGLFQDLDSKFDSGNISSSIKVASINLNFFTILVKWLTIYQIMDLILPYLRLKIFYIDTHPFFKLYDDTPWKNHAFVEKFHISPIFSFIFSALFHRFPAGIFHLSKYICMHTWMHERM